VTIKKLVTGPPSNRLRQTRRMRTRFSVDVSMRSPIGLRVDEREQMVCRGGRCDL